MRAWAGAPEKATVLGKPADGEGGRQTLKRGESDEVRLLGRFNHAEWQGPEVGRGSPVSIPRRPLCLRASALQGLKHGEMVSGVPSVFRGSVTINHRGQPLMLNNGGADTKLVFGGLAALSSVLSCTPRHCS